MDDPLSSLSYIKVNQSLIKNNRLFTTVYDLIQITQNTFNSSISYYNLTHVL